MKPASVGRVMVGLVMFSQLAFGQVTSFPFVEHFDSIADSAVPSGWRTTTNRRAGGDFFASLSLPRSSPHCLLSQNSTIQQSLTSPVFDFSNRTPDKLLFYSARSSTHRSGVVVLASTDGGSTFPFVLGDTLRNPGSSSYVLNTIHMPSSLVNQNNVRIRWQILGDSGGSTGTFRIDDVSLTTVATYDLMAVKLTVGPALANSWDSLVFSALMRNVGIQPVTGYSVKFFLDMNSDLVAEPNEMFSSVAGPAFSPGDSIAIVAGHSPMEAGDYRFFAVASMSGDEQLLNDTVSTSFTIGYPRGSLLVNEFMYAPVGDEPEWVELMNCSSDTINLKNWRISDNNITTKSVISTTNIFVPPQGYCIVAKDVNFAFIHPSCGCPVVVTSFSALNNNTPDAVVLYEPRLLTIDSVSYSPTWGGQGGKSLERIDTEQPTTDANNWGQCEDSVGSTPGRSNSIVRLANDLSVRRCFQSFVKSPTGVVPEISVVVCNVGKNPAAAYSVVLGNDVNRNSLCDPEEIITTMNASAALNPADSVVFSFRWESVPHGESAVLASVNYPADQRPKNNSGSITVCTSYSARSVVINEIMYDPLPDQSEWIELYNRGSGVVDLKSWQIKDRPTTSGNVNFFRLSKEPIVLLAGDFAVIAADSSILSMFPYLSNPLPSCHTIILNQSGGLSLGNDGDDIILCDLTGTTIDSVSYSPHWHRPDVADTKGRSLERINADLDSNAPTNWTTSVPAAGGTPGKSNSALTQGRQEVSGLTFSPNPFSPDGDGFEDFCLIQYRISINLALVNVKIYDVKGRLIRTLANSLLSASKGELLWDGRNDDRQRVRIGPYIVLIQATDSRGAASTLLKGVVIVAAKL